jgi:hypothetical protein
MFNLQFGTQRGRQARHHIRIEFRCTIDNRARYYRDGWIYYEPLGNISITVNKTTLFHKYPTPTFINEEWWKEAVKLGAYTLVLVRYKSIGVGAL